MTPPFHIAVVTGTRAEFGIFRPVLDAIRAVPALRLQLIATGMHLQKQFGNTVRDITRAGYPLVARVPMYLPADKNPAQSLARATAGLAATFRKLNTDLVMVLGDRLEILAAASAALAEQLPIAHLHGGESAPGQWDEQIRHAVTKMAHLHFVATPVAGARVRQMGEDLAAIHIVGAPAIDNAAKAARMMKPPAHLRPLLVLHPSTPDDALEEKNARIVIQELARAFPGGGAGPITAIGPNNDPGHRGILRAYQKEGRHIALTMSVTQDLFWGLMNEHGLLVGNSSAGIIEAATFGCAVINLGGRQSGRERSGNVIDADFTPTKIRAALRAALSDTAFRQRVASRRNIYGGGHAAARIVAVLQKAAKTGLKPTKKFADLSPREST